MHKLFAVLFLVATPALAGEAEIRQNLEKHLGLRVQQIAKTPLAGFYELVIKGPRGTMILYADEKGEFVIEGQLLDLLAQRNLTNERMEELTKINWRDLPLENSVKIVRGDGSRKLVVFSDPNCPACRKAEQELIKLNNVAVHTFLYPIIHPEQAAMSKKVWCSKDRGQAWLDQMLKGKTPDNKGTCDNPIDANLTLGGKLGIHSTPAIIFESGKRLPGYAPADRLEQMLAGESTKGVAAKSQVK